MRVYPAGIRNHVGRRDDLRPPVALADGERDGYDANRIRTALRDQGTIPVIPGRRNRKRPIQYDERRYKDRWRVEAMFCRLKDFRRIATRYDKLARNFLSAVSLAAAVAFWL
ncbi:transposase [Sphingosinicellaceae bacterium M-36]